jgi:hypothetical protein
MQQQNGDLNSASTSQSGDFNNSETFRTGMGTIVL